MLLRGAERSNCSVLTVALLLLMLFMLLSVRAAALSGRARSPRRPAVSTQPRPPCPRGAPSYIIANHVYSTAQGFLLIWHVSLSTITRDAPMVQWASVQCVQASQIWNFIQCMYVCIYIACM